MGSERQVSQNIRRQPVYAGLVKDYFWLKGKYLRQRRIEMREIFIVFNTVRQCHIHCTLLFTKWEVALAVDGKSEDAVVAAKNFCCSVALMNIKVNHSSTADMTGVSQRLNCDSNIIEHTEAGALRAKGMMCPSAERSSPATFQGVVGRCERTSH